MKKEIKKVPTMRFKGFMDDWEQRKVSDVAEIIAGGTPSTKNDEYWNPGEISWLSSGEVHKKYIVETNVTISQKGYDNSSARMVPAGSVLIALAGQGKTRGTVAITCIPLSTNQSIAAMIFNDTMYPQFVFSNLESRYDELRSISSGDGSRGGLNKRIVGNVIVPYTLRAEQKAIGNIFYDLDQLITLHQRKLDQLQTLKKYFLQNMFPAKEEKVPAIRFKGFTGDWEQCKFGEMANYKKGPFGSALKKDMFVPDSDDSVKVYEQQNVIHKNWQLERYYITADYAYTLRAFKVHGGDILVSCAGTIGEIYELPQKARPGIINQALMRVRVNNNIVHKNMYKLLFANMIEKFSQERSNGSAMKNIPPFADLKSIQALIPSIKEQEKTGQYFATLDNLITLHQRKCNQLQALKKFMLQNLFIQRK